jgi:hypothetical protein
MMVPVQHNAIGTPLEAMAPANHLIARRKVVRRPAGSALSAMLLHPIRGRENHLNGAFSVLEVWSHFPSPASNAAAV